jgi:membrane fusion protein, multidrug efflux system
MLKIKNYKVKLGLVCLLLLSPFLYFFLKKDFIYTDNAYIEANIITVRPKVSGYIVAVLVKDNSFVKADQIIAKIDDKEYKIQIQKIEAKIQMMNYQVNSFELNIDQIINALKISSIALDSAKASLNRANKDFQRASSLVKVEAISQQDFDKNYEIYQVIRNKYLTQKLNIDQKKIEQETILYMIKEAKNNLMFLEADKKLGMIDLENTFIKAKVDGVVSLQALRKGQLVSPQTALGYIIEKDKWIVANFKETDVRKIHKNQKVIVKIDAFPDKEFIAHIGSIAPATGSEFSLLPPENATGNFTKIVQRVPVKIKFDANQDLTSLRAGLSCEVKVELK